MAAIARVPDVTSHSSQHQPKNWKGRDAGHIFSVQIQFRDWYNRSIELYFAFLLYRSCWNQRYLKRDSWIFHQEAHTTPVKPARPISVSCQTASWFGWFQHKFHHMLHYATCYLTVFSCDQAALRTLLSVRQSVRPSVCLSVTPFYPRTVLAFGYCRCLRLSVCVSVRPSVCAVSTCLSAR